MSGSIGVGRVARAAPDGHTIVIGYWGTHVANGALSEVRMGQLHCSSPGAAKPIRDQSRNYDLLNRVTTIQITPNGWVQDETNDKVTKDGKVVATEVGWVEYRRTTDDSPCDEAKKAHPSE